MNLTYLKQAANFELKKGEITFISIESHDLIDQFTCDLRQHLDKEYTLFQLLDDDSDEIVLPKYATIVTGPFDLAYSKKDVQKALFAEIIQDIELLGVAEEMTEVQAKLAQVMDEIIFNSEYVLDYNENIYISDWLKLYDFNIKKPEGRFAERLSEYMVTLNRLTGKKFFFVINCSAFIEDNDYESLKKTAAYKNISVVMVDGVQVRAPKDCKQIIIDSDLCQIG